MIILLPATTSPAPSESTDKQADESCGLEAQSLYFVVDDSEAHYQRAVAAGAIVLENGDFAFGGHGYSCRDPEGHVWHFGTYNPRGNETANGLWMRGFLYGSRAADFARGLRDRLNPGVLMAGAAVAVIAIVAIGWMLVAPQTSANSRERGLAFRAIAPQQNDDNASRALARAEERPPLRASPESFVAATRRAQDATDTAQRGGDASQAADRTSEETPGKMRAVRQAAEKSADDVSERAPMRLRTAAQVFRQMRAARKAAAVARPRPAEARDQMAAVSTSTPVQEQKPARERAAKETAAVKETPVAKEVPAKAPAKAVDPKATSERLGARNALAEPERTRATQPPVKVISRSAEQSCRSGLGLRA